MESLCLRSHPLLPSTPLQCSYANTLNTNTTTIAPLYSTTHNPMLRPSNNEPSPRTLFPTNTLRQWVVIPHDSIATEFKLSCLTNNAQSRSKSFKSCSATLNYTWEFTVRKVTTITQRRYYRYHMLEFPSKCWNFKKLLFINLIRHKKAQEHLKSDSMEPKNNQEVLQQLTGSRDFVICVATMKIWCHNSWLCLTDTLK